MSTQLAMVIDSSKCIDCKGCMFSCKAANNVPDGFWRNWIKDSEPDFSGAVKPFTHFQPGGCMHCDQPTCVDACPTGATWKSKEDGSVYIDQNMCIGCGNCIPACPYGARFRNPYKRKAEKCDYCVERRAQGLDPACVTTCPTKARVFGDINDPNTEAHRLLMEHKGEAVQVINEQTNTAPNMYYLASTLPVDWTHPAKMPDSMTAFTTAVKPLVTTIVALSGLGVLAMLGRQLMAGSDDNHSAKGE